MVGKLKPGILLVDWEWSMLFSLRQLFPDSFQVVRLVQSSAPFIIFFFYKHVLFVVYYETIKVVNHRLHFVELKNLD